jgi:hypothetical protein
VDQGRRYRLLRQYHPRARALVDLADTSSPVVFRRGEEPVGLQVPCCLRALPDCWQAQPIAASLPATAALLSGRIDSLRADLDRLALQLKDPRGLAARHLVGWSLAVAQAAELLARRSAGTGAVKEPPREPAGAALAE